jgi:glutathione S-transferase
MPQTRAATTLWMNEELGGVCEISLVNLKAGEGRRADYLSLNPMGKVPTLKVGEVVITETAAICAYLADAYPDKGLAPATTDPLRGVYYRWMFFAPSAIEPAMLDKLSKTKRENLGAVGHGDMARVEQSIAQALAAGPYLLGENFSAADVVFGSTLNFATMFGALDRIGPIADYLERLTARAAYKRSLEIAATQMKEMGLS